MQIDEWIAQSKARNNGGGWRGLDGGWYSFATQYRPPVMQRDCACTRRGLGPCNCDHAKRGIVAETKRIKAAPKNLAK